MENSENIENKDDFDDELKKYFDLSKKKKKDKKSSKSDDKDKESKHDKKEKKQNQDDNQQLEEVIDPNNPYGKPNYTYEQLLDRINLLLGRTENSMDSNTKRKSIEYPEVERLGTTKVLWTNFDKTCKVLNRKHEHIMKFFLHDFGTDGSLNEDKNFVLKGRFTSKQFEVILSKYIATYIKCQNCNSLNTNLRKDQIVHLTFLYCDDCHAHRSVQSIRAGYHAETKADRKAEREQQK
jgi:translation initiation factor 2 subunit 2